MTDRELLELAAKACGYTIRENGTDVNGETWYWCEQIADCWNPLNDDGDALRMVVRLKLHVEPMETATWVSTPEFDVIEAYNDDPEAATRRAILRAAAEIGKAM